MPIAIAARTVFPFPYPRASYICPANSGNPKPAIERRQVVAAMARMVPRQFLDLLEVSKDIPEAA